MHKVAIVLGALIQLLGGYFLLQSYPLWAVLVTHVLGAALSGMGALALAPDRNRESAWFAGVIALLIPGVGWMVTLLIVGLLNLNPPRSVDRSLLVWRDRNLRQERGIRKGIGVGNSIAEILRGPDPSKRRSAILASRELDVKQALPLLRKGLQDSDEQVRIYAQNILSGMLESFEGRIKELEKRSRERPADSATAVSLAEQYFELIYLDVAGDEETSNHLLGKAVETLEQAAAQSPENSHVAMLQLRYALRQRDAKRAARAVEKLSSLPVDDQMVLPWQIELAFQQRDWKRMRELLRRFVSRGYMNPRIEQLARFWKVEPLTE